MTTGATAAAARKRGLEERPIDIKPKLEHPSSPVSVEAAPDVIADASLAVTAGGGRNMKRLPNQSSVVNAAAGETSIRVMVKGIPSSDPMPAKLTNKIVNKAAVICVRGRSAWS